jgi:hypothetical protein
LRPILDDLELRLAPAGAASPVGFSPSQIRAAYGVDQIVFGTTQGDGSGQTIAIVDAYDDPNLVDTTNSNFSASDLGRFDQEFNLPDPPNFSVLNQYGTDIGTSGYTGPRPVTDPTGAAEGTEALDVEWAHGIAPGADIILIECNSTSPVDLLTGVTTAENLAGVSVVSIGGGFGEDISLPIVDNALITPNGHQGVTFVAPTGDLGTPGWYPAYSSNVVAVGGTTLTLNPLDFAAPYVSEQGWSDSGGGTSNFESEPGYQEGVQSTDFRTIPDVSFDADPSTGVAVYDSYNNGSSTPWDLLPAGGASLASTGWAGLIAIADQGRVAAGGTTLDGPTQTLPALYSLPAGDFHDDLGGDNGSNDNGLLDPAYYDEVTGLGTPQANVLVNDLASYGLNSHLVVSTQPPGTVVAGAGFGLIVSVEDPFGNLETTFDGSVTVTFGSDPGGGPLRGTLIATATSGTATFSGLSINTAATGYTLQVTGVGLSVATTNFINVVAGPAAQLAVTTQPPAAVAVDSSFGLTVSVEDSFGNVETGTSFSGNVSLSLDNNPDGGVLGGVTSISVTDGVAVFAGLTINAPDSGYKLEATSGGLTITTAPFDVTHIATHVVVTTQPPTSVIAGSSFGLTVTVEDANDDVVPSFNGLVIIPPASDLGGILIVQAVNGVASFTGLSLDKAGVHSLEVTSDPLTSTITSAINVVPASLQQLVVTNQPPLFVTAGNLFGLTVSAEDIYGNVETSFYDSITVSLFENTLVALQGTLTETATQGVATFTDFELDTVGSGYVLDVSGGGQDIKTSAFSVTSAPATRLVVSSQPPGNLTAGSAFGLTATFEDAYGNAATTFEGSVTVASATGPAGSTLGGGPTTVTAVQGVATFSSLVLGTFGTYTLQVSAGGLNAMTDAVEVTPGSTAQLEVTTMPAGTVTAGSSFELTVMAADTFGNPTALTGNVIVALATAPVGGALSGGPTTVTAVQGVATFSGLSLDLAGTGYTLQVSSGSVTGTTGLLTVAPGPAEQLAVTTAPPGIVAAGSGFGLTVSTEDAFGNVATTFSGSVTVTLANNAVPGALGGTTTVAAVQGVASFANLSINTAGTGYTIQVNSEGLTSTTTGPVNVTPPATQLAITSQPPASVRAGSPFGLTVSVENAVGSVVSSFNGLVTLALASNPGAANLSGTLSVPAVNGIATFTGLSLNLAGSYSITASSSSLTVATTDALTVTTPPLPELEIFGQTTVVTIGSYFELTVDVESTPGVTDTNFPGRVMLALVNNPGSATLGGNLSLPVIDGQVTFYGLTLNVPGSGYTIQATSSGYAPATTFPLTVVSPPAVQFLVAAQPPASITTNGDFGLTIEVEDASGNLVPTFDGNVTVALVGKHQAGKLHGTTTVAAINGIATFSGLAMAKAGNGYKLRLTATGLNPTSTRAFKVSPLLHPRPGPGSRQRRSTPEFIRSVST